MNSADPTTVRSPTSSRRRGTLQLVVLCVLGAAGIYAIFQVAHAQALLEQVYVGQARIHAFVAHLGLWGPILFIVIYAAIMLLIWFPSWPCILVGGFLFGPIPAAIYSLIASTTGAVGVFELTRAGLGHRIPRTSPMLRRLDAGFKRDALEYIIVMRLIPVMPFGIVHIGAGLLGVSLRTFALGTMVGMIPGTFFWALLGHDFAGLAARGAAFDARTFLSPNFSAPLFGLAALALAPMAIRRIRERFSARRLTP